jgi:hypothetical protein
VISFAFTEDEVCRGWYNIFVGNLDKEIADLVIQVSIGTALLYCFVNVSSPILIFFVGSETNLENGVVVDTALEAEIVDIHYCWDAGCGEDVLQSKPIGGFPEFGQVHKCECAELHWL